MIHRRHPIGERSIAPSSDRHKRSVAIPEMRRLAQGQRVGGAMYKEAMGRRAYGTGQVYEKSGSYYGRWRTPSGRRLNRKIGPVRTAGEARCSRTHAWTASWAGRNSEASSGRCWRARCASASGATKLPVGTVSARTVWLAPSSAKNARMIVVRITCGPPPAGVSQLGPAFRVELCDVLATSSSNRRPSATEGGPGDPVEVADQLLLDRNLTDGCLLIQPRSANSRAAASEITRRV